MAETNQADQAAKIVFWVTFIGALLFAGSVFAFIF